MRLFDFTMAAAMFVIGISWLIDGDSLFAMMNFAVAGLWLGIGIMSNDKRRKDV